MTLNLPLWTRCIGAQISVETAARRLRAYAYAETRLMEAQAGWLAYIPQPELKIELAYHLYEDAQHIQAMRSRLPELGDFNTHFGPPNHAYGQFFDELTNTDDLVEQFVGIFWVVRPLLAVAYQKHIQLSDRVADGPTVRLLEQAIEDHRRMTRWGAEFTERLVKDNTLHAEQWRDHLLALLKRAGGVTADGDVTPDQLIDVLPVRGGAPRRFRLDYPARDDRFVIAPYTRKEGRAATDVWDEKSLLDYWFMMVEGEIEVTEACGRTLFDFPEAPWEFRYILARQLWDEARHAELSIQRFLELGGSFDRLPVRDTFPLYLEPVSHVELTERLVHINQVVEGWVTDDFNMMATICRQLGDARSAALFDQLIVDEWLHIKIGADWIPRLTEHNPSQRRALITLRHSLEDKLNTSLRQAAEDALLRATHPTGSQS